MMRKLLAVAVVAGLAFCAHAGSFMVYVKMHDGSVVTLDLPYVPNPDSAGMFRFNLKSAGNVVVHASNVWIVEKSSKVKR